MEEEINEKAQEQKAPEAEETQEQKASEAEAPKPRKRKTKVEDVKIVTLGDFFRARFQKPQ